MKTGKIMNVDTVSDRLQDIEALLELSTTRVKQLELKIENAFSRISQLEIGHGKLDRNRSNFESNTLDSCEVHV